MNETMPKVRFEQGLRAGQRVAEPHYQISTHKASPSSFLQRQVHAFFAMKLSVSQGGGIGNPANYRGQGRGSPALDICNEWILNPSKGQN